MLPRCADSVHFCRWSEVTRRLELWIQILEINEAGDFVAVEVVPARDVRTGGIFQLRQVGISSNTTTVNVVAAGGTSKLQLKSQLLNIFCLAPPPPPPTSPGSVEANPGGRAFSSGLGHHASDIRNTARSVSGMCGDEKHHSRPGRR